MAKGAGFVVVLCGALLHLGAGAAVKEADRKALVAKKYAHLQAEIDEWNRLGKPTELAFHHIGNITSSAKLTDLPEPTLGSIFSPTDYEGNVFFYVYNRNNPNGTMVTKDVKDFTEAGWSADRPTKVIIHGFGNNIRSQIFLTLVPALLDNGDYNVIGVDWGKLCPQPWYIEARSHVPKVGQEVAKLVDYLVNQGLLQTKDLHLLGHSLGAHVAGNVGKHVSTGDVQRITGMDPAMPLFLIIKNDRLHKNDAKTVDVVHTCSGLAGLGDAIGDVDFYPNGGSHPQPGCGVDLVGVCSHSRAYQYVGESGYEKNAFRSELCESKDAATEGQCDYTNGVGKMGVNLEYQVAGQYYLKTADSAPYDLQAHEEVQQQQQQQHNGDDGAEA